MGNTMKLFYASVCCICILTLFTDAESPFFAPCKPGLPLSGTAQASACKTLFSVKSDETAMRSLRVQYAAGDIKSRQVSSSVVATYVPLPLFAFFESRQTNLSGLTGLFTQTPQSSLSGDSSLSGTTSTTPLTNSSTSLGSQVPSGSIGASSNPQASSTSSSLKATPTPTVPLGIPASTPSPKTSPSVSSTSSANGLSVSATPTVSTSPSRTASPSPSPSSSPSASPTPTQVSTNSSVTAWPQSWPSGYYATNIAANVANLSVSSFTSSLGSFQSAFDIGVSTALNIASGKVQLNYTAASSHLFPSFGPYNSSKLSIKSNTDCALYLQTLATSSNLASSVQSLFNSDTNSDLQSYLQAVYGSDVKVISQAARVAQLHQNSSPVISVSQPVASTSNSSLSTGAIIGIAVGGAIAVFIIVGAIAFWLIHKRRKRVKEMLGSSSERELENQKSSSEKLDSQLESTSLPEHVEEVIPQDTAKTSLQNSFIGTHANSSLRELVRERLFNGMIFAVDTGKGSWKVLVLDRRCLKIISSVCNLTDILANGVSLVESLNANRERLPRMAAMYFVDPNLESISRIVADFERTSPVTEYKGKVGSTIHLQYGSAHLFTTNYTPEPIMTFIRESPGLVANLQSFTELHIDFMAFEERIFSLDMPSSISELFCPDQHKSRQHCEAIASKLVTVCSVLKERPRIRCSNSQPVSQCIAEFFLQKLDEYEAQVPEGLSGNPQRRGCKTTTFLILDRTVDLIEPLIHEFGYQAMCQDLLLAEDPEVVGSKYTYSTHDEKGAIVYRESEMDENNDSLWRKLRHLHVAEAIEELTLSFNRFLEQDKTAQLQLRKSSNGVTSVHDLKTLRQAVRNMPTYADRLAKFSLHTQLLDECMRLFYERDLERISSCEQDMSTGFTADGKAVKDVGVKLFSILRDDSIGYLEKLRLIMLSLITQPMNFKERRNILETSGIPDDKQTAALNLSALGVTAENSKLIRKQLKERTKKKSKQAKEQYELSRYVPLLQDIVTEFITGGLSRSSYPLVGGKNDSAVSEDDDDEQGRHRRRARSHRRRSRSASAVRQRSHSSAGSRTSGSDLTDDDGSQSKGKESSRKEELARPRYVVFIAGGITATEMRIAYELSAAYSVEIILGGSCVLNPKKFVEQVESVQPRYVESVIDFFSPVSPSEAISPRSYSSDHITSPRPTDSNRVKDDVVRNLDKKLKEF
ncbi:Protein transport protein sec1 [Galdieria sulphuraria]|nr:Protein transport protein sec1 [Galdieria sulphuraria]